MKKPEKNNEEKVNSIHKTKIEYSSVESFLRSYYKEVVSSLVMIGGGEGSQAFSYEVNGESFILRVNKHNDRGFKKD